MGSASESSATVEQGGSSGRGRNEVGGHAPQQQMQPVEAISKPVIACWIVLTAVVVASALFWNRADIPCLNTTIAGWPTRVIQHGILRLVFAGTPAKATGVLNSWQGACSSEAIQQHTTWQALARNRQWVVLMITVANCIGAACVWWIVHASVKSSLRRMFSELSALFVIVAGVAGAVAVWTTMFLVGVDPASWAWTVTLARLLVSLEWSLGLFVALYLVFGVIGAHLRQWSRRANNLYQGADNGGVHDEIVTVPRSANSLKGAEGPAAQLNDVCEEELEYIAHHRHNSNTASCGSLLVGLALSGGGIRAATTVLGALQGLARLKILPFVDYMSSVSGGGYAASAFSSLTSLNETRLPKTPRDSTSSNPHVFLADDSPVFSTEWRNFPFRDDRNQTTESRRAAAIIAHLRTHGTYLIARRGILKRDTLRAIGNVLTGIVFNLAGFLLVLFVSASLYLSTVDALSPNLSSVLLDKRESALLLTASPPQFGTFDSTLVREQTASCPTPAPGCQTKSQGALRQPTFAEWIRFELYMVTLVPRRAFGTPQVDTVGSTPAQTAERLIGTGDEWLTMRRALVSAFLTGVFAAFVALLSLMIALKFFSNSRYLSEPLPGEAEQDVFDKDFLWFQGLATLTLVVAALVSWRLPDLTVAENRMVALWLPLATLIGARTTGFAILVLFPNLAPRHLWTSRFRSLWGGFQATVIYALWVSLLFALIAPTMFAVAGHGVALATGSFLSLVVARLLTQTRAKGSSWKMPAGLLHFLLGAAVLCAMLLGVLLFGSLLIQYVPTNSYLILAVVATLSIALLGLAVDMNKLSLHYFYRDRLAETYLFSEFSDSERRQWTYRDSMELPLSQLHGDVDAHDKSKQWRNSAPYHLISAAINLAGSRDLTRKDRKSGYWLFSKLYCGSTHTGFRPTAVYRGGDTKLARAMAISGAAASSGMGFHTFFAQAFATVLFNVRLGYWTENPYFKYSRTRHESWLFWPSYVWREVTLKTTDQTPLVNLSDGGHTGDNVGIYPLLQRRCKVIIAVDAEQDAGLGFGSFTEALRHAYIDEGIRVDIDMSMIRPDPETGFSRNHCTVGRILYPDRTEQASWLIYLKNSLTGDEPEPVLNYKTVSSTFPHESTADQFFTDAQFESYRALGEHIVNATFGEWSGSDPFAWASAAHAPNLNGSART